MRKRRGFTLLELIIVISIFSFVVITTFRSYLQMLDLKNATQARQTLIESSYFIMERLQNTMKNYTIDYEEYFNRRMVGCDSVGDYDGSDNFVWSGGVNAACDRFTYYGNRNSLAGVLSGSPVFSDEHRIYYCSSLLQTDETTHFNKIKAVPGNDQQDFVNGSGCYRYGASSDGWQSFGQYAANFIDVQDDVDFEPGALGDDDDRDLGMGPIAIVDQSQVQELYLISQDKNNRVFLRRKLVGSGDWNGTGGVGDVPSDLLYTIQILKLVSLDAGHQHDFDSSSSVGVYDGEYDTWVCDYQAGFVCGDSNRDGVVDSSDNYDSVSPLYSGFVMPLHEDDGWINLFDSEITVTNWNLRISPSVDPDLAWANIGYQINPHVTLFLETALYGKNWFRKMGGLPIDAYSMKLETTFDIKSFY